MVIFRNRVSSFSVLGTGGSHLLDHCTYTFELGIPVQIQVIFNYICVWSYMYSNKEGGFSMRDIKTYLSAAPVLTALWFGSLAGLLIEINRLFPDALVFPFFHFSYWHGNGWMKKIRDRINFLSPIPLFFQLFRIGRKEKE